MTVSPATHELRATAQRLADAYPRGEEQEIVLTGSVSRGVADELSDIEILISEPAFRPGAECGAWARAAGAEQTCLASTEELVYFAGSLDGRMIEFAWVPFPRVEDMLRRIFAGDLLDHQRLRLAEALEQGFALRSDGRLAAWQARLSVYPEQLAEKLILEAVEQWGSGIPRGVLTLTRPGDRLPVAAWLVKDVERILRILFAVNRRWEPSWKRVPQLLESLAIKPERTPHRIDEALLEPDPRRALRLAFELGRDTLALVPPEIDVERPRRWLDEAILLLR